MSLVTNLMATRAAKQAELDALTTTAETEARDLTSVEMTDFSAKAEDLKALDARINELIAADEARTAAEKVAASIPTNVGGAKVISEPAVYRAGGQNSYFRDLTLGTIKNDRNAIDRLLRNDKMAREERAGTTTDGSLGDFVPPSYLVNEWIKLARAGRVVANQVTLQSLPTGTDSLNLPKIASGTATASQATQNSAVQNTDATTSTVTLPVVTIAGQQVISLQSIEQSPVNLDEILLQDLAFDYATQLDKQVISGAGTSGTLTGMLTVSGTNSVTYTSGSPTAAGTYSKAADAIQRIHTLRFLPPTHCFMHPRRWAFFLAASDGNSRPLVVPVAGAQSFNSLGNMTDVASEGVVGTFQGLNVYLDSSIPINLGAGTNEDRIIFARAKDSVLYEGVARTEALPQTYANQMSVLLRFYNYAAFTAGRYAQAISIIGGTGLVTPTF